MCVSRQIVWSVAACGLLSVVFNASVRGAIVRPCGSGQVVLTTLSPGQGALLRVEVRYEAPGLPPKGRWLGKRLHWWSAEPSRRHQALLGVDLEQPPGPASLELRAASQANCTLELSVRKVDFRIERLSLPKGYVQLSPANLRRALREKQQLVELFGRTTPRRLWSGAFELPIPGGRASSTFGRRRILNGEPRSPHSGIDFGARKGAPVRAPQAGRVALVASHFFSGRSVVVDHGLGLYSFFGHLSQVEVRQGQALDKGAIVGRVGSTGRVTAPHLHWSVRADGARVNPLDLLKMTRASLQSVPGASTDGGPR